MTKVHKVICDRCQAIEDLIYSEGYYFYIHIWEMPKGWSTVKGKDFCRDCTSQYIKHMGKFK